MYNIFGEAKQRLAGEIDSHSALPSKPIAAENLHALGGDGRELFGVLQQLD